MGLWSDLGSAVGNYLSGYKESPEYVSVLNNYNTLTNTNPDFYKTVTDLATMKQIDDAQSAMYEARADYRNNLIFGDKLPALSNTIDNMDLQRLNLFNNPSPVGSINGNTIYSSYGSPEGRWRINDSGTGLQYHEPDDDSFGGFGGVLSFATGGLSDLVQGDMPGAGWAEQGDWAQVINPVSAGQSMFSFGISDLVNGIDKYQDAEGDFWDKAAVAADRAFDPFGVDTMTRETGDVINDKAPEVVPYIKPVATTIGTLIYPGAGTAAGYGIGAKLEDGTRTKDYLGDFKGAGVAYLGGAAGGGVGGAVQSATGSAIAGGAAGGATSGMVSSTPQAIREQSWSPLVRGGLTGAVVGGLGGAARELGDLNRFAESLGKSGSTAYDGGVDYVPVGAGSFADSSENPTTLNQLMTELETPSGGGMSLQTDPIPTESINPTGTPEFSATALPDTDTSSLNYTDTFQYAEPAYKTAKTAYNLYNIGKGVYDKYQNIQDMEDARNAQQAPVTQQTSQPVQTPITAPVGASYTLGNMPIGEDERRAWGRVLV